MGEIDLTADGNVFGLVGCRIGETKGLNQVKHDHCSFTSTYGQRKFAIVAIESTTSSFSGQCRSAGNPSGRLWM